MHRTPTLHCSARLALDENGYPHLQRLSAKKQNDTYRRDNIWVNTKGRVRSVLILAILLKTLTNPATACPIRCEPLQTRPAGMTVSDRRYSGEIWQILIDFALQNKITWEFLAAARSSSPFSFANFQNCKRDLMLIFVHSVPALFSTFGLRYFYGYFRLSV